MTEKQHELRRNLVTCSRLPAILGKSSFANAHPIDVYNAMVFGETGETNKVKNAGNRYESAVLLEFAEQMECELYIPDGGRYAGRIYFAEHVDSATFVYPETLEHPSGSKMPWFGGTPDAIIKREGEYLRQLFGIDKSAIGAVVQAKLVSSRRSAEWGESQFGEPPIDVIVQVMGEIIVTRDELKTDIDFGFVVALIGEPTQADYRFYCVRLDAETEKYLLQAGREFWQIVQRRDVSQLDASGNWKPYFEHQYPRAQVESVRDEDGSFGMLWKELCKINKDLSALKSAKSGIETAVKLKLKDAALAYANDPALGKNGLLFSWKNDADSKSTDWEQVAKSFLTKRNKEKFNKAVAQNTKPVSGSRRFLIKGANGHNEE